MRATPSSAARLRDEGSRVPGRTAPARIRARSAWSICACSGAAVLRSTRRSRLASVRFWSAPTVLIWPGREYQEPSSVPGWCPVPSSSSGSTHSIPASGRRWSPSSSASSSSPRRPRAFASSGSSRTWTDRDHFVWFRGFADMDGRRTALTTFYGGPVWAAHRDAANATMVDSDDVLLLRPVRPAERISGPDPVVAGRARDDPAPAPHPPPGAPGRATSSTSASSTWSRSSRGPGPPSVAWLETKRAVNDYPRLPVREDADVVVCLSALADEGAATATPGAPVRGPRVGRGGRSRALRRRIARDPEQHVLRATPRSALW